MSNYVSTQLKRTESNIFVVTKLDVILELQKIWEFFFPKRKFCIYAFQSGSVWGGMKGSYYEKDIACRSFPHWIPLDSTSLTSLCNTHVVHVDILIYMFVYNRYYINPTVTVASNSDHPRLIPRHVFFPNNDHIALKSKREAKGRHLMK